MDGCRLKKIVIAEKMGMVELVNCTIKVKNNIERNAR